MKRSSMEAREFEAMTMADCLMLLSRGRQLESIMSMASEESTPSRVFECKTCNRKFPSFQALGGHRASHKKPRLLGPDQAHLSPPKPKTHECSICGLEFAIGQALGGHMRRHRANAVGQAPVVMKKSNSRRVLCLDLNLTPTENDLEFRLGIKPPMVDCFF